jgi:SanA protein
MKRPIRIFGLLALFLLLTFFSLAVYINQTVEDTTHDRTFNDPDVIPKNKVGLLLGTSKYKDKGKKILNDYYTNRIKAAAALYMAGKVDYIIVSGDNSPFYNETIYMREDLVALGVPLSKIYLDNAGFRTLDSILRCRDIFGQSQFTIISQAFHNERAIYIADHKGIKAVAFNAEDGSDRWFVKTREFFARVKMMVDFATNRQAKLYGDKVIIP